MKLIRQEFKSSLNNKKDIIEDLKEQFSKEIENLIEFDYDEDHNIISGKFRFYKFTENPAN